MSANKFVLKHHQIEVDYTLGITSGLPALIYRDGRDVKTFTSTEITTDETAEGSLVSVPLLRTIDTGGERFGFFLSHIDVPPGQTGKLSTVGIYEKFDGPDSVPQLPPSWRCIEFEGTARTILVPLEERATA